MVNAFVFAAFQPISNQDDFPTKNGVNGFSESFGVIVFIHHNLVLDGTLCGRPNTYGKTNFLMHFVEQSGQVSSQPFLPIHGDLPQGIKTFGLEQWNEFRLVTEGSTKTTIAARVGNPQFFQA